MITDKILPARFQAMTRETLGEEIAEKLLASLSEEPETSIRVNRRKGDGAPVYPDMTPVAWCSSGYYLPSRPVFTLNPLLHAGAFYVQDASSMIYESIAEQLAGGRPVKAADLCAAPGGKTTAMLNALPDGSVMLANEFVASRAKILKENLVKYGYPDIVVTNSDPSRLTAIGEYFDIVAVDAPCSGEGMMRKDATARSQWSEGLVKQCSALQREILTAAVEMTAPGGFLIYSTCTFNTSEDEDNAAWIAGTLGLEPVDTGFAGTHGIAGPVKGELPCLRFMPGFTKGEGLFVAVFHKPYVDTGAGRVRKNKKEGRKRHHESGKGIDRNLLSTASSWLNGEYELRVHDSTILALSTATAELLDRIPTGVRIMAAGVETGEAKGKDLVPSHRLALSCCLKEGMFPDIALGPDEALRYLARENITLPESTPRGYVTVSFQGHILGFMKHHGNRSNSLYPQDYRIRALPNTQNITSKCLL